MSVNSCPITRIIWWLLRTLRQTSTHLRVFACPKSVRLRIWRSLWISGTAKSMIFLNNKLTRLPLLVLLYFQYGLRYWWSGPSCSRANNLNSTNTPKKKNNKRSPSTNSQTTAKANKASTTTPPKVNSWSPTFSTITKDIAKSSKNKKENPSSAPSCSSRDWVYSSLSSSASSNPSHPIPQSPTISLTPS